MDQEIIDRDITKEPEDKAELVPHLITIVFRSGAREHIRCRGFSLEHNSDGTIAKVSWNSDLGRGDDQLLWLGLADIVMVYKQGSESE